MKWYEYVTESGAFKTLDNPATAIGGALTALIALVFGIVAYFQNTNTTKDCATNPLRLVYNPERLHVLGTCQQIDVTVQHIAKERDGDIHIQAATDSKWLSSQNYSRQHGDLVVEYMPSDPWPKPTEGQRLRLTCTWVSDAQHGGWNECHPVWAVQPLGNTASQPIP